MGTQGGWTKSAGNPVLGNKSLGTCFDVNVIRVDGVFRMYFSWRPRKSLAVCHSSDGINWDEPREVMLPDEQCGWENQLNRNCVVWARGKYHLWYTGQARGFSRIGYATSKDGYQFTRQSSMPVMIPEFPWEFQSVMNPFVLHDEERDVFRMWYAAGETYEPNALGYAESKDGANWSKSPINPIFVKGQDYYDKNRIGGCEVVRLDDGRHLMFYIGYEDIDTARICIAESKDGIVNWRRLDCNPIVSPDKENWDGDACYKPSVFRDEANNRWLLWYNGRLRHDEYIGLVIHQGLEL